MELAITGQRRQEPVGFRRSLRPRIQRGPGPPGRRRLPQCGSRRHQGAEDALGSQRHHQEVQEAEGRRCASRRPDGSDLRRRRRDLRGQAAQLRAEGQPQDVPRRDVRDPVRAQSPGSPDGRRDVRRRFGQDQRPDRGKLKELEVGRRPLIVTEDGFRAPLPVRAQHSLRGGARRAGPGSGLAGRCRHVVMTADAVKKIEEWLA